MAVWLPDWVQTWLPRPWRRVAALPERLWQSTLRTHPFLHALTDAEKTMLQRLVAHFLHEKEFYGAHGLTITDSMAIAIAAQACRPLLHLPGPGQTTVGLDRLDALNWYDDFVGIVVQPGAAVAQREITDASGVVHHYREALAGEAMQGGPVMLSWTEVQRAPAAAAQGSNVVIHEFIHKMDMRGTRVGQPADGAPDWSHGCLGSLSGEAARTHWRETMSEAYQHFREALSMAERFGAERPWLDAYGATHPAEFFAVTCEAYFVNRAKFEQEFPALLRLYDGFFKPVC
ncbi:M90 family metallopeptidase [Hydrogenophaga sp. PAMC20947]|uniref:M90 family metallopeptidase n=1 Tax=Hydrogenophaga sp. PAMC20947 TaxID=2565558 RepID=UPI00109DD466|nr:M90 family metallopeptidase [Hydrogenophaga sp. PAMC20947]QCB45045.1 zinc-dependent peptidase [Hydrogenophaga sp. PAMC20947]